MLKTLHLTLTGTGITFLVTGLFLLGVSSYLYYVDFQFDKKIRETPTNPAYMNPIRLPPYYYLQPILTEIGSILIGTGSSLLLYKKIRYRMNAKST